MFRQWNQVDFWECELWAKNIKQMLFVIMKMDLQNLFDWHIYLRLLLVFFAFLFEGFSCFTRIHWGSVYISIWIWFPFGFLSTPLVLETMFYSRDRRVEIANLLVILDSSRCLIELGKLYYVPVFIFSVQVSKGMKKERMTRISFLLSASNIHAEAWAQP